MVVPALLCHIFLNFERKILGAVVIPFHKKEPQRVILRNSFSFLRHDFVYKGNMNSTVKGILEKRLKWSSLSRHRPC